MGVRDGSALASLRAQIARIEGRSRRARSVLPFGVREIDRHLPGGGLALGALHEVAGGGNGAIDGAAAALFAGGIAARTRGKVLWCLTRADLFAPALAQAGLAPDRVIYLEAGDERTVLACMEEGRREGGLGAAGAEIGRRSMSASRRLQLAAEGAATLGSALRRWRISVLPSEPLPVPGIGRPPLAGRADPGLCRRECGFRAGGVRCHGSSRCSCRPGPPTGCGASSARWHRRLTRRWS